MERSIRIQMFVEEIWQWYALHKRLLPWRDLKDRDPAMRAYKVMVSEIMLQQTQVSRVKIVFKDFLDIFPSIQELASASNKEILLAWRGMGYNARALRLRDAAQKIVTLQVAGCRSDTCALQPATCNHAFFPKSMEDLRSIPGIGDYTAAAIRNFAFNIPTPCLDTNIRRILHRTFVGPENSDGTWKKDDKYLLKIAEEVLDTAVQIQNAKYKMQKIPCDAASWHAALMDFGSLVQTKSNPKWNECPLTAKKIMKTSQQAFAIAENCKSEILNRTSSEPGRFVGTKYIPNRIFRGKVIEELRDTSEGLKLDVIGRRICLDWSPDHRSWLQGIVQKLLAERMIAVSGDRYRLFE